MPRKIDLAAAPAIVGTLYPPPFDEPCLKRHRIRLGDAAGLTQYGVNLCRLAPGTWTAQRHWHRHEDEFVYVVEGAVVLVTDGGEETLGAGDCAGFKAGDPDGHCLQNRSDRDALVLEIGTRHPGGDGVVYSDIDMKIEAGRKGYLHKNGTPYPVRPRSSA
jgi:uncharacterized cupin superfamily protein